MQGIIGRKIEQTQRFLTDGTRIPVTVLDVSDNAVLQVKTTEKDKYTAIQLGFGKKKKATKPLLGHVKKAGLTSASTFIKEIRVLGDSDETTLPKIGDRVNVEDVLQVGDIISASGLSKGKGFQGGVKRHHFKGGPRTHGQSDRERAPGSLGQTTTPGRVYKGKRMAGHMGYEQKTVQNLLIVHVDNASNIVWVKGLVPGPLQNIIFIKKTGKMSEKKYVPVHQKEEPAQQPEVAAA